MVRPVVNRFTNAGQVANEAAKQLFEFVSAKLATQDRVDVAITGGTVGIATLAAANELDFNSLDLARLHIWWCDERFVESESPDRNAVQANNAWLKKVSIPKSNIHEFPALDNSLSLDEAAQNFANYFSSQNITFDLMLMGMGPDGHIASLFPGKSVGFDDAPVVAEHDSPKPPPLRLSFSYGVINSAEEIWFTVSGADKAEAISIVFGDDPETLPAGRIHGKEKTVWFVDQTAGNLVWGC